MATQSVADEMREYWAVVEACMVRLLDVETERAARLCEERLRRSLARTPRPTMDLGYHIEPFYTAFDLAHPGVERMRRICLADEALARRQGEYNRILDEFYGPLRDRR